MRQLSTHATPLRYSVVVAVASAIALAASSPIHSAVTGSHISRHASASPVAPAGGTVARADCSKAAARELVEQHNLNGFALPDPVVQVLCGPFTGTGSEAMAITIGAPTCWGTQRWAVFRFADGDWQLVLDRSVFVFPLVAVGADIQETTPVFRPGDSRCNPSGGSHARIWHWDGSRLVAGPWKQVTKGESEARGGESEARGFYSPSHNIACGMFDNSSFRYVDCQSRVPPQHVTMNAAGRVTVCRQRGTENSCNLGDPGEGVIPTLGYGRQITVGRFRCLSLRSGVRCTVIRSGKGFLINSDGVRRIGS